MSRSFRTSDQFADKRETFADRKAARDARRREFDALGFDEPESIAALPIYSPRQRDAARRAFR